MTKPERKTTMSPSPEYRTKNLTAQIQDLAVMSCANRYDRARIFSTCIIWIAAIAATAIIVV
ncbi:hypothetical protein NKJ28_00310 [Mesorhizobium sp. M0145]|uniref:hypothetical protein n=1 Tax=Mesorhizobium sp. M0145 TaxID=2956895 RepID=UPI00333ADEC6